MAAFAGLSLSRGASGRLVLSERVVDVGFNWRLGALNSLVAAGSRVAVWKGYCVRVAHGAALDVRCRGSHANVYARDRVIDFGKSKGSMLGTLSSRYLRWMTKNLKGTMMDEWANYAQETLDDPLYMDRIEWEKVEKLLVQSHDLAQLSNSRDALAPARMYGWDIDNELAWSKVNFALLGTTKGGKIPRVAIVKESKPKASRTKSKPKKNPASTPILKGESRWANTPVVEAGSLRDELDRRRQARRERLTAQRDALLAGKTNSVKDTESKFPGRGGLLNKLQENNTSRNN